MKDIDELLVSEIRLAISETPMDEIDRRIAEERFINKKTYGEIGYIVGLEWRAVQRRAKKAEKRLKKTYGRYSEGIIAE